MWSPQTGAQTIVPGPVQQVWQRNGFEIGILGYPTGKLGCDAGFTVKCTQTFQGGTAAWSSTKGGWAIPGAAAATPDGAQAEVGYPVGRPGMRAQRRRLFPELPNKASSCILPPPAPSHYPATSSGDGNKQASKTEAWATPTSGQNCGLKDQGCFQNFEQASILTSPATGAPPSTSARS